jgi:glutamate-1-semialdehyde 2,1-aminomutase
MDCLAPLGPVYQAGTLSGNPLAMAAGLAQLRELIRCGGWSRLEDVGAEFERGVRAAIQGRPMTFHRMGSMFCLYFCEGPVRNLADAKRSDVQAFKAFFHGCLERGVYFAPSQFEAGFLCLAHGASEIEETLRVATEVLKTMQ